MARGDLGLLGSIRLLSYISVSVINSVNIGIGVSVILIDGLLFMLVI